MPEIHSVKITDLATHPEKKLNVPDLAEYWGVSDSTVYRLTDNGALSCSRIGRRIKVDRDVALQFEVESGKPADERPDGQARR